MKIEHSRTGNILEIAWAKSVTDYNLSLSASGWGARHTHTQTKDTGARLQERDQDQPYKPIRNDCNTKAPHQAAITWLGGCT